MTSVEDQLLQALVELERAAGAHPKPPILPLLEKVDQLAADLPAGTPGELRHFLQRKSYEKARLFLLGRQEENLRGTCGH